MRPKSQNHIFVDKDKPEAFVLVEIKGHGKVNHTFYLADFGMDDPDARLALVFQENSITTIELDDGEKHVGILGTWPVSERITHKFTCMDGLEDNAFGRAVTRKARQ